MNPRDCPDCDTPMRPIKVLDATHTVTGTSPSAHFELGYAAPDAERSFFTKTVKQEGILRAMLCPDCGRALLFAIPHER